MYNVYQVYVNVYKVWGFNVKREEKGHGIGGGFIGGGMNNYREAGTSHSLTLCFARWKDTQEIVIQTLTLKAAKTLVFVVERKQNQMT